MARSSRTEISVETENPNGELSQEHNNPLSIPQTDKVSLHYYKDLFLSSIWIIIAFVVISTGIAYLVTKLITPTYQTTTTIWVSKANLGQMYNYDAIMSGTNLGLTYAQLISSGSILEQVGLQLDSSISSGELKGAIVVTPIVNTQLIEISVEHSNPDLAVKIVNSLVAVFSSQLEQAQLDSATYQDNMLENQLQELENEIARLQEETKKNSLQLYTQRLDTINTAINDLRKQIELSNDATRKQELSALLLNYQDELVPLSVRGPAIDSQNFASSQDAILLDQYQRNYYNLMQYYINLKATRLQNMVTVTQIEQPALPKDPIRPILVENLILGFVVGLLLSAIYIFFVKLR